jgi:glycosyltransferase involved in cell wall biosynthesis
MRVLPPIVPRELYETETERTAAVFINPSKYKGLDLVIAMARARPDIPFHLVLTRKKQRLDIEKSPNISITGPFNDMRRVYRNARVVLAPSQLDETWGRIATEAHISGIPVLASARGGLLEAVGPGGICLPHDSPEEEWVTALGKMWDDPDHYAQLSLAALDYANRLEIQPEALVNGFIEEVCAHVERAT